MSEVARRCLECGTELRDLTDGQENERDRRPTTWARVKTVLAVTAVTLMGVAVASFTLIGATTVFYLTALMWPWLPWA